VGILSHLVAIPAERMSDIDTLDSIFAPSRSREAVCLPALIHVMTPPWHAMLRACSAKEVFDFFHSTSLAMHSYRHHCLAALRRESSR
jgi:hypothetical protein